MKSTNHTCSFDSLTSLDIKRNAITGNGNYVNLLKVSWNHCIIELIFGGFQPFGTTVFCGAYALCSYRYYIAPKVVA